MSEKREDILYPLHSSAARGDWKEVNRYLSEGRSVDETDDYGNVPLHCAVNKGHINVVQGLIKAGANVNIQDGQGWTPLHYAANKARTKIAEQLISDGALLKIRSRNGQTPIDVAESRGHTSILTLFEKHDRLNLSTEQPSDLSNISNSWTLICPRCSKQYVLGEDSILVSDEDVIEDLSQFGAKLIPGAVGIHRKPELVIYKKKLARQLSWPSEREKTLKNIQRIKEDIQQGQPRSWSCQGCSSGNAYPRY